MVVPPRVAGFPANFRTSKIVEKAIRAKASALVPLCGVGNRATVSSHAKSLIIMQQSESGIRIMPAIELAYALANARKGLRRTGFERGQRSP